MFFKIFLCVTALVTLNSVSASPPSPPNIVIILLDDVGWNDLSYNTPKLSQISTPNIDMLSNKGIKLKNHYVQTTCTPTVSSFFIGLSLSHSSHFFSISIESQSPHWAICCQHWSYLCDGARLPCWIAKRYPNDATVTS